ncbi:thiosulfate/3-mercaptopyruvate sulfurtransferase [Jatrophihabitans endophyticus]|uniref:Thiosulfate/3-mercaptopyruvate sulfurtransferase n=1 Tax=Jatrophihabitans endophyticus TaxID=1206085 RepID=A0A1M5SXF5_9ACTN|nr:sulfurtransferase [Jatrophihabitans endophyticus]SHH43241.1 thiosulfate/3-mercaptopyruvate sulfurtransferase [Jatrophihabitans endophyticus]
MTAFGPLVDAAWLATHLEDVRTVDVRWYLRPSDGRTGRDAYDAGHLPGAVHLDVDTDLSAPATREAGRHPLPTPEHFAAALARVGIAAGTPVVAYDDVGGSTAARLWWLLHVLGEPVAVLDGGLDAWLATAGELVTDVAHHPVVERAPRPWPAERFVVADELPDSGATVYDARTAQRYAHGDPVVDPRAGHVPGARSAPWQDNLGPDGRFRPAADLAERYPAGPAVAYCGSGVTACHDLLALTLAGRADIALYPGSWSQWGADPTRPAETD